MNDDVNRHALRQSILSATQRIGELAKLRAWNEALELIRERQGLLETFFGGVVKRDASGGYQEKELIHAVLEADRSFAGLAETGRRETLTELEGHLRTHDALMAYQVESQSGSF